MEEGSESHHREHVYSDDTGAQSAVDEGAVYENVYVVELVAEDRYASEDREHEQGERGYIRSSIVASIIVKWQYIDGSIIFNIELIV